VSCARLYKAGGRVGARGAGMAEPEGTPGFRFRAIGLSFAEELRRVLGNGN